MASMILGLRRAMAFAWKWRGGATGIPALESEVERGDRQVPATLLRPDGRSSPLPGWVVLHGVTRPGRHHPTLLRFARALAGSGASVLVPEIPEWRELDLAPEEAAATVRASVLHLDEREDVLPGRIGIMGFSLGVPQVLLAAADPALAGHLRGVAGFGGYGSLDRTLHFLFLGEHEWEGRTHRVDTDPYGRWVIGGNYLTRTPGFEAAEDVALALLELARQAGDLQVGAWEARFDSLKAELEGGIHPSRRLLYRAFTSPERAGRNGGPPKGFLRDLAGTLAETIRRETPSAEPTRFLDRISLPVRLVHGRGDRLIPYSETLRLVEAFPRDKDVRAYLTGLFSHSQVDEEPPLGGVVAEQLQFLRMLSDLLTLV